jgi:DNA-directed RNA polymerase subunit RPC12/RpoP
MILEDDGLICPYCGSLDTGEREQRARDRIYECDTCGRSFSAPQ